MGLIFTNILRYTHQRWCWLIYYKHLTTAVYHMLGYTLPWWPQLSFTLLRPPLIRHYLWAAAAYISLHMSVSSGNIKDLLDLHNFSPATACPKFYLILYLHVVLPRAKSGPSSTIILRKYHSCVPHLFLCSSRRRKLKPIYLNQCKFRYDLTLNLTPLLIAVRMGLWRSTFNPCLCHRLPMWPGASREYSTGIMCIYLIRVLWE